jgi:osmotically-inducible protein OsmY
MNRQMARFVLYPLALALVLAMGCNTTQSPEQQFDDTAITTSVKSRLATDIELSTITGIEVNTTNGVVTLSGQVSSDAVKRRAGEIAENVDGVVRVANNIEVSGSMD